MKKNGAIRKVMLIVLLSILGSYCIGASDGSENKSMNTFDFAVQSTYSLITSVGNYCHKLWSEIVDKVRAITENNKQRVENIHENKNVVIQNMTSQVSDEDQKQRIENESSQVKEKRENDVEHGNNYTCTDGRTDCVYNQEFFNDTWFTGKLDEDWTTHLDPDTRPMLFVDSYEE